MRFPTIGLCLIKSIILHDLASVISLIVKSELVMDLVGLRDPLASRAGGFEFELNSTGKAPVCKPSEPFV